jgi:mono/diheme cytochrome c family protein
MCGLCHTEVNPRGIYREDHYLAGGMRVGANPQGVFISRNLTPDPETGIGSWSEQQLVDAIRKGRAPEGRLLNLWGMPWMYLHNLTDEDATAISRYLKSMTPVHNLIPQTLHYGAAETIVRKLLTRSFPIARPPVLTYAVGSFANRPGIAPDVVERGLVNAQWGVLAVGMLALPFAAARRSRMPRTLRGWLMTVLSVVLLLLGLALGWFIYNMPTLSIMPPDRVAAGAAGSIYSPDISKLPPEKVSMIKRGQYLYTASSCAYCHENDGSGGFKVSGQSGTIFTPNISSDKEAGIGAWSDAEIARAVRGGVSRNGRPLYWQGMPWDHFSNWDEEDMRSLISYLRAMPPIAEKVPPYRPPAADDCAEYTFWTHKTKEYGCKG